MVCQALQSFFSQYTLLLKSTGKASYISSSIFVGLLREGFCTKEETKDDEGAGDGGGNFQEAEGTVSSLPGFLEIMRSIVIKQRTSQLNLLSQLARVVSERQRQC